MKQHTRELHESLIRLAKGMITAWERWLSKDAIDQAKPGTIEDAMQILGSSVKDRK